MRQKGTLTFFVVALLIIVFTTMSFTGIRTTYGDVTTTRIKGTSDIRWGIDIRGGVDVTFTPPADYDATDVEMGQAESILKDRLVTKGITDYEIYTDTSKDRVIVRFPWKENEVDFDPEAAIRELGETSVLAFHEGSEVGEDGKPAGTLILEGRDVEQAYAALRQDTSAPIVSLTLTSEGAQKFAEATTRLAPTKGSISIWMDDRQISVASVQDAITDGKAMIDGSFTVKTAQTLADQINGGALPFKMISENYSIISPSLGTGAKDTMVFAGGLTMIAVFIFMVGVYRLPGFIAFLSLVGQVGGMIAAITGFFGNFPSFTLTLPGIAGIILSIGFGVDANVITAERIKEELQEGKTLSGAIESGFTRGFSAILDGNVTVIIVSIVLMGAFGPPSSFFAKMLTPVFFMFGPSTTGTIYSFGFTLLVGVIFNMIMGVYASHAMLKSISKFKALRNPWLYGGVK
ncbi:protein translocase subunit SecD [Oscillospiraceae bacterium MB08-C2-2]|nr:protein translocase subunit SecD [Oscillospiraceae bacterium MB08-C2-2]